MAHSKAMLRVLKARGKVAERDPWFADVIYNIPIIHQICQIMKVIPIDYQDGPKGIIRSLQAARQAVAEGDLVCIFPEGGSASPHQKGRPSVL